MAVMERINSNKPYRVSAYVVLIVLMMIYLGTPVAGSYVLWECLIMQIIFQGVATKNLVLDAVQGPKSMTIVNAHYSKTRRIRIGTRYYIVGKDETGEEISFSINGQDYKNEPYNPSNPNDYFNTMRIRYYEHTGLLISFTD